MSFPANVESFEGELGIGSAYGIMIVLGGGGSAAVAT
jgi:hypothetical protein